MIAVFLLMVIFIFISWYCWRKLTPFLKFHNYIMIDWRLIRMAIPGKQKHKMSANAYYLRKMINLCKKHQDEGMIVVWIPWPMIIVFGAEAVKFCLNEPTLIDKPPSFYKFFDLIDSNSLFRSNGKALKMRKKWIGPAFYPNILKGMVPAMNEHAQSLVEELNGLENNTVKDVTKMMSRKGLMLFFDTALGIKQESAEKDSRMISLIKLLTEFTEYLTYRILSPWLYFDFVIPFFGKGSKHLKGNEKIYLILKEVVEDLKKAYDSRMESTNSEEVDSLFLQPHFKVFGEVLIEEHIKDPSFTIEKLRMELITLIYAGYDTSAQSLTWTLWLLGQHEDVQEKAYEEIKLAVNEVKRYEDAQNLKYLECVIKESLRLYPVGPIFARSSNKSLQFGKHTIPRGTTFSFNIYGLHRNPELYPDPEIFNPERFSESSSRIKPWTYMPFAGGGRSCIGKSYAMIQMKIFLSHIIRNFKLISLTREEDFDLSWEVVLRSTKPLSVKFIPRKHNDVHE